MIKSKVSIIKIFGDAIHPQLAVMHADKWVTARHRVVVLLLDLLTATHFTQTQSHAKK